jgi:aromatic ring hydroxylase
VDRRERVDDVTTHPAFRNTVRSIAQLYDMTHDQRYPDVLTTPSPTAGEPVPWERVFVYRESSSSSPDWRSRSRRRTTSCACRSCRCSSAESCAVGSEFASRHEHYERFYHGAPYVNLPAAVREGAPDACESLADAALSGYALSDLLGAAGDDAAPLTSSPAR